MLLLVYLKAWGYSLCCLLMRTPASYELIVVPSSLLQSSTGVSNSIAWKIPRIQDILKGKICCKISLLIWASFIGQFIHLVGGEESIVILASCEHLFMRADENLVHHLSNFIFLLLFFWPKSIYSLTLFVILKWDFFIFYFPNCAFYHSCIFVLFQTLIFLWESSWC